MQKRNKDGTWGSIYSKAINKEIKEMRQKGFSDRQMIGFLIGVYEITERTAKRWLARTAN